jgi:hypothetical protein
VFHHDGVTQQAPLLFVEQPTERPVETSFMFASRFDDDRMIVGQ